jgi:hypothetical protein
LIGVNSQRAPLILPIQVPVAGLILAIHILITHRFKTRMLATRAGIAGVGLPLLVSSPE